jgi:DNA-binding response OmpR family regulator
MTEAQLESAWMQFGRLHLDPVTYTILVADRRMIFLTATEFQVLYDLIFHAGRFRTSEDIFQTVWGGRTAKGKASNVVAVYIRRLRHKIETDPTHPVHIITSRSKGYLFRP